MGGEVAIGRSWKTSRGVEVELMPREGEEVGAASEIEDEEERKLVA